MARPHRLNRRISTFPKQAALTCDQEPELKLLLVDGSTIFRMGLRVALATAGAANISIVGECATGGEARALAATLGPDMVVTELHLPDRNGLALTRDISGGLRATRVLVLTTHAPETLVHQAIALGASGYVLKTQSPADIIAAVYAIERGDTVLPSGISPPPRVLPPRRMKDNGPDGKGLSPREQQVFDRIVAGSSNKNIAEQLGITMKTVECHRSRINEKLGVHSTADIVRLACMWGLIGPASARHMAQDAAGKPAPTRGWYA